jgi:hypothetical protein
LRSAEANAMFWQRLGQASMKDWLWGDPIKDALNARNEELARLQKQQDDFKAIVAGQLKIEQAVKNAPTPYVGSINPPTPKKKKSAGRAKQPEYVDFSGKPITPTEDQLFFLNHPPKPRRFQDLEAFQEAADGIEERNTELMESLQRAWLQASDQRITLIELERDSAIKALDEQELSEEQHAQAVSLIRNTANQDIANEIDRLSKTTDKTSESAFKLSDTFQGFGQVATSAFEDAIIKGEKFSDVLAGLAEDIQRLLLRNTMNKLVELGINAASSAIGGWMGGSAYSNAQVTADWTPLVGLRKTALGAAFDGGNVIPFARGGIVGRPTIFPMARGYGLMGEAGPEAVMPLKRMPSGNLGVEAGGKGVTVNVINNTPAQVKTEERRDGSGGMTLNVVIDAVEQAMAQRAVRPGTTLNRALSTAASPLKAR